MLVGPPPVDPAAPWDDQRKREERPQQDGNRPHGPRVASAICFADVTSRSVEVAQQRAGAVVCNSDTSDSYECERDDDAALRHLWSAPCQHGHRQSRTSRLREQRYLKAHDECRPRYDRNEHRGVHRVVVGKDRQRIDERTGIAEQEWVNHQLKQKQHQHVVDGADGRVDSSADAWKQRWREREAAYRYGRGQKRSRNGDAA